MKGRFKVHSLEKIGTLNLDIDIGVIRVPGTFLRRHAKRNSLVKVSSFDENLRKKTSIIRIVRAATGDRALRKDEVALQYDDRIELGIKKVGTTHLLEITPVHPWFGIPSFLLGHPSPLVRRETVFAFTLMIIGAVIGLAVGLALQSIFGQNCR